MQLGQSKVRPGPCKAEVRGVFKITRLSVYRPTLQHAVQVKTVLASYLRESEVSLRNFIRTRCAAETGLTSGVECSCSTCSN
jgi:hypothetical protein